MPLIQVNIMEGRPPEKVKQLIENITRYGFGNIRCS